MRRYCLRYFSHPPPSREDVLDVLIRIATQYMEVETVFFRTYIQALGASRRN